jgi:4'-phosphopantetheinyl transferase
VFHRTDWRRFHFKDDAKLSMAGRLLIRKACSEVLDTPYDTLQLARTKAKKPFLATPNPTTHNYPRFNFNLSHSGDYVVLAASVEHQIGVDVTDIRRPNSATIPEFFTLMTPQFTPNEWKQIKAADGGAGAETGPETSSIRSSVESMLLSLGIRDSEQLEHEQLHHFHRFWSLKESYIKAVGVGLQHDLQRLDFTTDAALQKDSTRVVEGATLKLDGVLNGAWVFHQCYLDEEHTVAVASCPFGSDAAPVPTAGAPGVGGSGGVQGGAEGGEGDAVVVAAIVTRSTEPPTEFTMLQFTDLVVRVVSFCCGVAITVWNG